MLCAMYKLLRNSDINATLDYYHAYLRFNHVSTIICLPNCKLFGEVTQFLNLFAVMVPTPRVD